MHQAQCCLAFLRQTPRHFPPSILRMQQGKREQRNMCFLFCLVFFKYSQGLISESIDIRWSHGSLIRNGELGRRSWPLNLLARKLVVSVRELFRLHHCPAMLQFLSVTITVSAHVWSKEKDKKLLTETPQSSSPPCPQALESISSASARA